MDFKSNDILLDDPMDIATPGVETILDTQKFSPAVRRWAYCLFGRLLFVFNSYTNIHYLT